jgi:hypothetical protein
MLFGLLENGPEYGKDRLPVIGKRPEVDPVDVGFRDIELVSARIEGGPLHFRQAAAAQQECGQQQRGA